MCLNFSKKIVCFTRNKVVIAAFRTFVVARTKDQ